jgi:hypothetical protein
MKKEIHLKIKIAIVFFYCVLLFACGYSFVPRGEHIDSRIQTVYVQPFGNKTSQAEMENYVRAAFINQFIQNSRFKIASSAESADAVVKGAVVNLYTSSLARLRNDLAAEERATVVLEVTFQDNANGKVIWSAKHMTDSIDYALKEDINLLPATQKQSLIKLSNDVAERAFNLMMSGF